MGLYPQPNQWQCGPFALKHALMILGKLVNEKEITRIAGTHWWSGTDEFQLARAARKYNCSLPMTRRHEPEMARRELTQFLQRGIPSLLCVDQWGHWITVVKSERQKFILLDSNDKAVLTILTWPQLKKRWVCIERDELDRTFKKTIYDFHPVIPKFRIPTRAKFSLARARYLRRADNKTLSRRWDDYVSDLMTICTPRTALSENVLSMGEFFRRHMEMILDEVDHWHGEMKRGQAAKILQHMQFVADTYGLVIHEEDEKRAIAGITSILTLWAAGKYGVHPVYT